MSLLDGWKVCPRCANQLTHGDGVVDCESCGFVLYGHSAVTTSALPVEERRVLLARRAVEPARGLWDCLGGFVHEGAHPLVGLGREVREETGLEFEPQRFLGMWMGEYAGRATLNLFWTGRLEPGDPRPADDVDELRWFSVGELPRREELAFERLIDDVLRVWRDEHA